jgi:hypothetical protein
MSMGTNVAPTYTTLTLRYFKHRLYQELVTQWGEEDANTITSNCKIYLDYWFILWNHSSENLSVFHHTLAGRLCTIVSEKNTKYIRLDEFRSYRFTSRSRIHLYGDVTMAIEGLQNVGLCLVLSVMEQGAVFIVPHLLWLGALVFWSDPKDQPNMSPLTTHYGVWRIYSNPYPHGAGQNKVRLRQSRTIMFDYLRFYIPLKNLLLICRTHPNPFFICSLS